MGDQEQFTEEELKLPPCKYEYLDHTADVQLHAWGDSLKEAYEQCGIAMFGYMTELPTVEIKQSAEIEATEGEEMRIKCKCYGEEFTLGKHPQGTEVKAITYSAMQIVNDTANKKFEVFVIIDI
ncbi:unnamed protein product [Callosobruchus maculatus]|uniref:Archease domain-containing protein n=1 Tax=Callosobruchus maculatus TaxID=64391 RepID=A0A653DAC3_CALMS|nr:unnamed protein product [Callosobruchus maculatus]